MTSSGGASRSFGSQEGSTRPSGRLASTRYNMGCSPGRRHGGALSEPGEARMTAGLSVATGSSLSR